MQILQSGVTLTLVADHPGLATPTGIDVDSQGRIWVVSIHTHFRPDNYVGPEHDQVLVFSDLDNARRAELRQVFYDATDATMDLELGPNGWVYLAERDRILRVRDEDGNGKAEVAEDVVVLDTEADHPHNGLEGLAWHPNGDLVFGLGENQAKPWTLTGTDGSSVSGTGEGGIFGCLANGSQLRRIARGLWNPFGICVRTDGQIFAADNDPGERPPCRLLHIMEGGDYGYQRAYDSEAHHPFVTWNAGHRGTLPMMHPCGEAPCGVTPLGCGLIVPSWSDHRIDLFRLRSRGASYTADRIGLLTGGRYFRPGCIAPDPNAIETKRIWYLTDWVDGRYQAHGFGRLWRLEIDLTAADWVGDLDPEPLIKSARLANDLRTRSNSHSLRKLMELSRNDDAFVARSALLALSARTSSWEPKNVTGLPAEDRVSAVLALKLATAPAQQWIEPLLADSSTDVQFETLRWIADSRLTAFLPSVEAYLGRSDLDYRRFEAAVADINTLKGRPEAGIRDTELLLSKVCDDLAAPSLRAHALRLLPAHATNWKTANEDEQIHYSFPEGLTPNLLTGLLALNEELLSLEVVRTLSLNPSLSQTMLTGIASGQLQSEAVRAETVVGLASVAVEQMDLMLRLAGSTLRGLREAALRCLRFLELTQAMRVRLEQLAVQHLESTDTFRAILHPASLKTDRPPIEDAQAWLRVLAAIAVPSDKESGRRIFQQTRLVRCSNCHRYRGRGKVVGSDLSNVSLSQDLQRLLESILQPGRQMAPEYQPRTIQLRDGRTMTGIRLRSSTSEVLRDANGQNRRFNRDDIESMVQSTTSFMPAGLASRLTLRELRDLLAFLQDPQDVP